MFKVRSVGCWNSISRDVVVSASFQDGMAQAARQYHLVSLSHGNLDQIIFGSSPESRLFCDYMFMNPVYIIWPCSLGLVT